MAVYAFDGTWNVRDGAEVVDYVETEDKRSRAPFRDTVETNVHRFCEFYGWDDVEYLQGVGTRFGPLGRILGGAFGVGGRHRIRKMYRALCGRYADDQRIDLIGFSRGAAQAIHFANLLHRYGVRDASNRHFAWWYYKGFGWTFRFPKPSSDDVRAPSIGFLGLFDTVATFGWPVWPFRNATKAWDVSRLPPNVNRSFHAMALDEIRRTFELIHPAVDLKGTTTDDERRSRERSFYQVWFRGAHANIGGGYIDRGLSDIPLVWMLEQAVWTWRNKDLPVPQGIYDALEALEPGKRPSAAAFALTNREALVPDPDGAIGRPRRIPRKPAWRSVPATPWVHYTAVLRTPNLVSDAYNMNRSLLRTIPGDRTLRYDPPWFYSNAEVSHAWDLARELFGSVPIRPSWLTVGDGDADYVFRSDTWIAQGSVLGRHDSNRALQRGVLRDTFLEIAVRWLESGGRIAADDGIYARLDLLQANGLEDAATAVEWVCSILDQLRSVMPRSPNVEFLLRRFDE